MKKITLIFIYCLCSVVAFSQMTLSDMKYFYFHGNFILFKSIALPNKGIMCVGSLYDTTQNFPVTPVKYDQDILMLKMDSSFNVLWSKRIGGSLSEHVDGVSACKDGGFLVTGQTSSTDGIFANHPYLNPAIQKNLYVVKIDSLGNTKWVNTFGGGYSPNYRVFSVAESGEGGAFVMGITDSAGTGDFAFMHYGPPSWYDWYIIKFDSLGNKLWVKIRGGTHDDMDCKIISDEQGGIFVVAYTGSTDYDLANSWIPNWMGPNGYVGHWDSAGNIIWGHTLGGGGWDELSNIIYDTTRQQLVASGHSNSTTIHLQGHTNNTGEFDYWAICLDTAGAIVWSNAWGGDKTDVAWAIGKNELTSEYFIGGYAYSKNGDLDSLHTNLNSDNDAWVIVVDTLGNLKRKQQFGGNESDAILSFNFINNKIMVMGGTASYDGDFISNIDSGFIFLAYITNYPLSNTESNIANPLVIYPNPCSNYLYIKNKTALNYQIIAMNGAVMQQGNIAQNGTINTQSLPIGNYIIECTNKTITYYHKFLKQ